MTVTASVMLTGATATAGKASPADFKAWTAPKPLKFLAGQNAKTLTVAVLPDTTGEPNETATVTVSAPSPGLTLGKATGTITVLDDDTNPQSGLRVSVGSAGIVEGDTGVARALQFRVSLSDPPSTDVQVLATLTPGTAVPGTATPADYKQWPVAPKVVKFTGTQTSKVLSIAVIPDSFSEETQTALVTLSSPSIGLGLGRAGGTLSIIDDDDPGDPTTTGPVVSAACQGGLALTNRGPATDPALIEVSGIDAGLRNPSSWWVHNDSGDSARVFALNADGATQRSYSLSGAGATDWEDIETGPGPTPGTPYLYLADIGDNGWSRADVSIYRVPEPVVSAGAATTLTGVDRLRLRYPDGSRDAEALIVDPVTGALVVIAKSATGPVGIYEAPANLAADSVTTLVRVGTLALGTGVANAVTGADISKDGRQIAVRTYGSVRLWGRGAGTVSDALQTTPCFGPAPVEVQGEAIGFQDDGRGYVTMSEGTNPVLHQYTAP
jgi:hypothetical protein